jgi:hypothetical protein
MDILNNPYGASSMVALHRRFSLLTGEFVIGRRTGDAEKAAPHQDYLGSSNERWNRHDIFKEAKSVRFLDWTIS